MKLYYQISKDLDPGFTNFGDDLNLWMWPKLLPGLIDDDESTIFLGAGTVLGSQLPPEPEKIVFGTGIGYTMQPPAIDETFKVYCVRGPMTAKRVGLPASAAVTDSGVLVRTLVGPRSAAPRWRAGFVPHVTTAEFGNWDEICSSLGIAYIDPAMDTEQVLAIMQDCEMVFAEAMHGAIVADALRVPWVPIISSPAICTFKWQDWLASLGLEHSPHRLPILWDRTAGNRNLRSKLGNHLKRRKVEATLRRLVRDRPVVLSSDQRMASVTDELLSRLDRCRADLQTGNRRAAVSR